MRQMMRTRSTKRIQPARGWCATVGGNTVQIVSTYPASPEARPPIFGGSQPCVSAAWLAERQLLAGDIESNPGPLDVSRESGVLADQVEETPGRASLAKLGCRTPPQLHAGGVGRQQQHENSVKNQLLSLVWHTLTHTHNVYLCKLQSEFLHLRFQFITIRMLQIVRHITVTVPASDTICHFTPRTK